MTAPRSTASRYDEHRESGFTMVELMVSLTVITIGVLGAVGVFNSAFSVAAQASIRSRAVGIATQHIEAVRGVPYDDLIVSPTVRTHSQRVGATTFNVSKAVTGADAHGITGAYKQATVTVTWKDLAGTHVLDQATFVYPGGRGPHQAIPVTTTSSVDKVPPAPNPFSAAAPPTGTDASATVDLSWGVADASPLTGFSVRYATGGATVVVTDSLPATARTLRVTGLSAATTYSYQIAAKSLAGTMSLWGSSQAITTASAPATACVIGTPSIDPSRVPTSTTTLGGLSTNPVFSVNTSGSCSALSVVFRTSSTGPDVTRSLLGSSGFRTRSLDESGFAWDPGPHFVELYDGAGVKRATVKLTVCGSSKTCK